MALNLTPNIGPWSPKVSQIMKMWIQPCNVDPLIWVAAYFAASPSIAYAFLAPDCKDYVYDRFRAAGRRRRQGTYNVADFADPINPKKGSRFDYWVFTMGKYAQIPGAFFTLVDGILETAIMGTSLAYQWNGCKDPAAGWASLSMTDQVPILLPAGEYILNQWLVEGNHLFGAGPTGISTPRGYEAGVGFSITQKVDQWKPLPDCNWTAQLWDEHGNDLSGEIVPTEDKNGNYTATWFSSTTPYANQAHNYKVVVFKDYGVFYVDGMMTASGSDLGAIGKTGCGYGLPG